MCQSLVKYYLTVCVVVNREITEKKLFAFGYVENNKLLLGTKNVLLNIASALVAFIPECPTLNFSKIFSYITTCFNFIVLTMCQTLV